jgi:hypothetical protein
VEAGAAAGRGETQSPGLATEHVLEELLFVKLGLPFPMASNGIMSFLARKGQKSDGFHRSYGVQQDPDGFLNEYFLAQKLTLFHRKSSARQTSMGPMACTRTEARQHGLSKRSSQVMNTSAVASAKATCAASATPNLRV